MGCVSSKKARSVSPPAFDIPTAIHRNGSRNFDSVVREQLVKGKDEDSSNQANPKASRLKKGSSAKRVAFRFKFGRLTEGEHVAAGWPAWLTAVAGEAIDGLLPLNSNLFERLEKIGQGTYSVVYRARDLESGKMVALKKVRFDNLQPESVRFMAREIAILRKLDHPNIMKLEGIITSRLSSSIYLVFEYMEHDLLGLLSCPDIKFNDAQIKCYMRQLLWGIEHCHSRGVIHRDVKTSNILVNNEGILKIADFGLANFLTSRNTRQLTSRVVTLWYRPPELLLGSTNYGASVDMWSVGCVFAEVFLGRPLFKGRTEVEQLHKIFKLCGSPSEEYWERSKLPLSTIFKPKHPYDSTLRERCKELPKSAVNLIESLLSIEPYKRRNASSALDSEYFNTKPYACDPSSLPKYPPNKEIDAKFREEARRKKAGARAGGNVASRYPRRARKGMQEPTNIFKVELQAGSEAERRNNGYNPMGRAAPQHPTYLNPSYDTVSESSQLTEASQTDSIRSVPVQITASSGFAWANRQKPDRRLYSQASSKNHNQDDRMIGGRLRFQPDRADSFNSFDLFPLPEQRSTDEEDEPQRSGFSGPLMPESHRFSRRQENKIHQAVSRSRFYRDS